MARAIDRESLLRELTCDFTGTPFHGNRKVTIGEVRRIIESIPTLTQPNDWISVEDRLPEPGERVLATDCGFVGEFYINKRGKWQRYNVNCSELLMALDILYWMPLPAPPGKDNNAPTKKPNEPLTLEQLREMDGEPVWVEEVKHWALIDIEKGGQWDGIPFAVWAENGVKFTYNVESRDLHCYRRPPEGEV